MAMGRRRALSALLTQHDLVVAATVEDADDRDGIVENGERDNESPRVSDRPLSPIVRRPGRPDVVTRGAAVRERRKFGNAAGPSQKVTIAWVKRVALSGEPASAMQSCKSSNCVNASRRYTSPRAVIGRRHA